MRVTVSSRQQLAVPNPTECLGSQVRKRAAKWERTKDVRERDRARWEAHQARKAQK